jgi:hypothetical protein
VFLLSFDISSVFLNKVIIPKTLCSTYILICMQLFSGGWDFSSQTIPWKEVEVRMYALSMVRVSCHLVKNSNCCHKM